MIRSGDLGIDDQGSTRARTESGLTPAVVLASDLPPPPLDVNVGERTNITGSARFRNLIRDGDYDTAQIGRASCRERV